MKHKSHLITGVCIAAVAFAGTLAGADKKSPAPAMAKAAATEPAAKKPRPISYHGNVTAIDKSAKSFTIGKIKSRTIMVTDQTNVSKAGSPAKFTDLSDNEYVSGSYMKMEDGTFEAKSLKIGGKTDAEKAAAAAKKAKKDAKKAATEEEPAAEEEAPKKK